MAYFRLENIRIKTFSDFVTALKQELKIAEKNNSLYSSNNAEQIYRQNALQIIKETNDLCEYYKSNGYMSHNGLLMIFQHLKQLYLNEYEKQLNMLDVNKKLHTGMLETYHNLLGYLVYNDTIKKYHYNQDTYLLDCKYNKMLQELNFEV